MKRWDLRHNSLQSSKPADDWPDSATAPIAAELHAGRQPQAIAEQSVIKVAEKKPHKRHALLLATLMIFAVWLGYMTFRKPALSATVTNFRECVDYGYPTTETEPVHCTTASGRVFIDTVEALAVSNKHNLSFTTLVASVGGPRKSDVSVIKDQKAWEIFWAKNHALLKPTPPILAVDFTKLAVAAAVYGQQETDGYRITITSVYETDREVDIEVTKSRPGLGCQLQPKLVSPYHLVTFARPTKPTVFVIVDKQQAACETSESADSLVGGY